MFKKFLISVTLCVLLFTSTASAQISGSTGSISYPNYLKLVSGALLPVVSTYTFGDTSNRWAKIWLDDLDATIATIGSVVSGALTITVDDANALLVETAGGTDVFNVDTVTPKVSVDAGLDVDSGHVDIKTGYSLRFNSLTEMALNTTQTPDALGIALPASSNALVMMEWGDRAIDFAHALQTNPTLFIQSADATTIADWISLSHDQTDGVIATGTGDVKFTSPVKVAGTNDTNKFLVEQADTTELFNIDTSTPVMSTRVSHNVYNQETHLANLTMQDARVLYFGSADDASVYYNAVQTPDTVYLGSSTDSNAWVFAEKGDSGYDFAHALQTNPTIFINSANQSATEWGSLAHDQTNFVIDAGAGGIDIPDRLLTTQGADVASASTIAVGTDGNAFELTGTTAVNLITNTGWQEGATITLIANENVTINHGTATSGSDITILLAGAGNFGMTANDTLVLMLSSTTAGGQAWREISRTAI